MEVSDSIDMPPRDTFVPRAPPYVGCIQWVPSRFAGGASPVTISDLVFTQAALRSVMDQMRASDGRAPILGVFTGTVFEDPTCARRWARLEEAVPARESIEEDADAASLARALDTAEIPNGSPGILGWYRSHQKAGLYLSPEEARLHEDRFRKPWECALVLAGPADHLAGGVFQRTDPEGLSRSLYTPFYELVGDGEVVTPRRTAVTWTNYQTESRVIGEEEDAPVTIATIPELAETVRPVSQTDVDSDAEWDKLQTRRSLMAVERSLGPGTIGVLGAPAMPDPPTEEEHPINERPPVNEDLPVNEERSCTGEQPVAAHPAATDGGALGDHPQVVSADPISGFVGRSRRRRRADAGKIAMAAAGFGLMAAAGWVGSQRIIGRDATVETADDAGLRFSPNALLGTAKADADSPADDPVVSPSLRPSPEEEATRASPGAEAEDTTAVASLDAEATAGDSARIDSTATDAPVVPAPEVADILVQDPLLSGYDNAMTIFRAEVDRYDTERRSFDEGLSTCNPLNLSYRGVTDAFRRLEQRMTEAKAKYGESAILTFSRARRQFLVTKTHYELTDCPMPIGG